jgi:hypothetical protein
MKTFLRRFRAFMLGCLCGFDRIRFRGSKRQLTYSNGINGFLFHRHVLLRDFTTYAQDVTEALFQAVEPPAKQQGIYRYLNSSHISTEETALQIAAEHKQTQGLMAVLGRVEPCQTIQMRRGSDGWWMPSLHSGAKCLHYYHYYLDPDFGLRYTRLQSWFPFTMHIGLNGRDWLACPMAKAGIGFTQNENCFTWVVTLARAPAFPPPRPFHCRAPASPSGARPTLRSTHPRRSEAVSRFNTGHGLPPDGDRSGERHLSYAGHDTCVGGADEPLGHAYFTSITYSRVCSLPPIMYSTFTLPSPARSAFR